MTKKDKLLERFLSIPKDFTFDELKTLLRSLGYLEDNKGKTLVSEGIDANYQDMINYSVFALILMKKF